MEPSSSHSSSPPSSPPITTSTTTITTTSASFASSAVATGTGTETETATEPLPPPLPSPSLRRSATSLWPEECVECVANRLALATAGQLGPLPVATALANLFQVCTGWRSVSQSEILWEALCRHVWDKPERSVSSPTWRSEYIRCHRITSNFRRGRYRHSVLEYGSTSNNNNNSCRCLALSEKYVACGFSDGAVRIFDIASKHCIRTLKPVPETRLGPHSRAVAGIIIIDDDDLRLVFAYLDGSIFSSGLTEAAGLRRILAGNTIDNGIMVDFTGSSQWWVGLYAGIPGHAIRIWNARTEQLVYTGGDYTDPDAVRGWHLLTNPLERVGRLRITPGGKLVTVTRSRFSIIDLETQHISVNSVDPSSPHVIFQAVDVSKNRLLLVTADINYLPIAKVVEIPSMVEKVRFHGVISVEANEDSLKKLLGGLNSCCGVLSIDGRLIVYDCVSGSRLYGLQEVVHNAVDLVFDDQCIACCGVDEHSVHLYDFSVL